MNAALAITLTPAIVYAAGVVTGYKFAHWQVWAWLLLAVPALAGPPVELPVEAVKPYTFKEDAPYYGVKAGDEGLEVLSGVTGWRHDGPAVIQLVIPHDFGWKPVNVLEAPSGDEVAFDEDTEGVGPRIYWPLPKGTTRKFRVLWHGGKDRDKAIKAIKDGKAVTLWQHG